MFDNLSNKLSDIFKKITSKGYLTEEDITLAMREIRIALLEADVSIEVVKELVNIIKEKALGEKIIASVQPGHMVTKIFQEELTKILGSENQEINLKTTPPAIILMVGLQGSGKTTSTAKLANYLTTKHNKKVIMSSLDIYRPAAQKQLEVLASKTKIDSVPIIEEQKPLDIVKRSIEMAKKGVYDVLIFDTAGRLHIDETLMDELKEIEKLSSPVEILLVADSLTGQDAVNIAKNFKAQINLTGIILTRIDGDNRGGAALSMKYVTNCPIKFVGIGEKIEEFEIFYPDRIASRILGKGDIISLVEKAIENVETEDAEKMAKRLKAGKFDFNDLLSQLRNMKKMGGFGKILGMIPGLGQVKNQISNLQLDEKIFKKQEAIILSMTKKERKSPEILNPSRKNRIAKGSGTSIQEVNQVIKQQFQMQKMMKKFKNFDQKSFARGGMQNFMNMFSKF